MSIRAQLEHQDSVKSTVSETSEEADDSVFESSSSLPHEMALLANSPPNSSPEEPTPVDPTCAQITASSIASEAATNNTENSDTYHRYYHVFREGELVDLIDKYVDSLHVLKSYYDHANWCVIAEKVQVWTI